jgi:hypothetical protein
MYKCGFREAFQAVAEHEKTCSKRAPAVEAMANASDGAGSSAVRAGLPSTAADTAVQRSAAVAADSDRASKPAPLESGGQLGHYCFIGKSEPILREGTLCDTCCCCCSSAARLWLERDECGAQTVCAHRQRAGQRTSGAAGADHTWLVRARCGGARTAREDRQSGLRLALADVSVLRVRPVRLAGIVAYGSGLGAETRTARICLCGRLRRSWRRGWRPMERAAARLERRQRRSQQAPLGTSACTSAASERLSRQ